jgi:glycosyltransferase involved in cell wall biosynthesis
MKKICFFCSVDSFDTGMPISTFKLIQHFGSLSDYEVHVVLPGRGDLYTRICSLGGVRVEPIAFQRIRSWRHVKSLVNFLLFLPGAFLKVRSYFKNNGIALVHFSDVIDFPFYPCARLSHARAIAHVRIAIDNKTARFLFAILLTSCIDAAICISRFIKNHYALPDARALVVYNAGPDLALFDPQKTFPLHPSIDSDKIIVGTIANFLKIKGHSYFLDMARAIETDLPGAVQYLIVGNVEPGHGLYEQSIRSRIESLGLGPQMTVLYNLPYERIPALLSLMHIFVHLSVAPEGLGGVVLEAMAMGLPVVAFDSGGVRECFIDGKSGFLVKKMDYEQAASRVLELIKSPDMRTTIGAQARNDLAAKFSYAKHFSEINKIYDLYI